MPGERFPPRISIPLVNPPLVLLNLTETMDKENPSQREKTAVLPQEVDPWLTVSRPCSNLLHVTVSVQASIPTLLAER